MESIEIFNIYKNVYFKCFLIIFIFSISNCIGNKLYGDNFSKYDLCNLTFKFGGTEICVWTISHFVIHFIVAYEYDVDKMQQMFFGFYWEFIEEYIMDLIPGMKVNCTSGPYQGNYWRAEIKDIYMNILGMLAGEKLRSLTKTSNKKYMLDSLILITLIYNISFHIYMLYQY